MSENNSEDLTNKSDKFESWDELIARLRALDDIFESKIGDPFQNTFSQEDLIGKEEVTESREEKWDKWKHYLKNQDKIDEDILTGIKWLVDEIQGRKLAGVKSPKLEKELEDLKYWENRLVPEELLGKVEVNPEDELTNRLMESVKERREARKTQTKENPLPPVTDNDIKKLFGEEIEEEEIREEVKEDTKEEIRVDESLDQLGIFSSEPEPEKTEKPQKSCDEIFARLRALDNEPSLQDSSPELPKFEEMNQILSFIEVQIDRGENAIFQIPQESVESMIKSSIGLISLPYGLKIDQIVDSYLEINNQHASGSVTVKVKRGISKDIIVYFELGNKGSDTVDFEEITSHPKEFKIPLVFKVDIEGEIKKALQGRSINEMLQEVLQGQLDTNGRQSGIQYTINQIGLNLNDEHNLQVQVMGWGRTI